MSPPERYQFGPFHLDIAERECRRGGELIPLPGKAFDLLQLFVRDPGRTIPKAELMTALWPETAVEESNLTQTVFLLRKALGDDPEHPVYLQTVPRMGYKFVAPVTSIAAVGVPLETRNTRMGRTLGLGAAAAIAAVAILLSRRGPPPVQARTLTPFSSEQGANINPVWSPDGKGVAFAVKPNDTDKPQLYVRWLASSTPMQLTHDGEGGAPIAWTPGRIVFQSSRAPAGLWTISPVGGEPQPLLAIADIARRIPHVSRDGSVAAYYGADQDGLLGVMISSPVGSPAKPYAPAPFATRTQIRVPQMKFSPDGKQLLLLRAGEVWLMPYPADASNPPRRILENPDRQLGETADWMPDNRRIVLSMSSRGEPHQLQMADTVSGETRALSNGTTTQRLPAVSPDGKKLIFQAEERGRYLVSIDLENAAVHPLLANNRGQGDPAWAANGSAMVYVTNRSGQSEIWLQKPSEDARPLVTNRDFPDNAKQGFISPVLSPDGRRLVYSASQPAGGAPLWMSAVAGGARVLVVKPKAADKKLNLIPGSWSPNGEWLTFLRFSEGKAGLYKVKTTGEAEPVLLKAGQKRSGGGSAPVWSPTGEWILTEDDGMKLISPDGKVTRAIGSPSVTVCGFSRDGALLYCLRQERRSDPAVFFSMPVAGGPEKVIGQVAPEDKPLWGAIGMRFTLTPDGKSFSYTVMKTTGNLWTMDGIE